MLRWFSHKERMALIRRGQPLEDKRTKEEQTKTLLVIGLPISLIGLGLTIGLLTLGLGPWLLAGLLPLFAGLALLLTAQVLKPAKEKEEKVEAVSWLKTEEAPTEEPLLEWDRDEEEE